MERLDVQLITYNVGCFPPGGSSLAPLLGSSKPDLVLLGLQEVNSGPSAVLVDTLLLGEDPWTQSARRAFAKLGYVKIRSIRLLGLVLSLFCLEKHVPYLRGIETQYTRLGLNGYWGNKGTVSVRFSLYGVSVCVLNSHLAAHDEFNQARIESYDNVLGTHAFANKDTRLIMQHDYVFWMGDFNFRLEVDTFTFQEAVIKVEKGELDDLLEQDQLRLARKSGAAFAELTETLPTFPPTFKYKVGTSVFDAKRRPAWTDRILYKANRGNYDKVELEVHQHDYRSHPAFLDSDHKPVTANFTAAVFSEQLARQLGAAARFKPLVRFVTEELYCGEDSSVLYTVDINDRRELALWDWIGVYRADRHSLQDHEAFSWAPVNPIRDNVFRVDFEETTFVRPGRYRLVYYSSGSHDILGFSPVIPVRIRGLDMEVALEATEEL